MVLGQETIYLWISYNYRFKYVESVAEVTAGSVFISLFYALLIVKKKNLSEAMETIKNYYKEHPLRFALITGIVLRFIAVIFSKGFGMHDDHFLVIEVAQSWADGTDYNNWLPGSGSTQPSGHSFFYCGIHYLLFTLLQSVKKQID